jgi:hypothetical protein
MFIGTLIIVTKIRILYYMEKFKNYFKNTSGRQFQYINNTTSDFLKRRNTDI